MQKRRAAGQEPWEEARGVVGSLTCSGNIVGRGENVGL
jgi:hypothetical protein